MASATTVQSDGGYLVKLCEEPSIKILKLPNGSKTRPTYLDHGETFTLAIQKAAAGFGGDENRILRSELKLDKAFQHKYSTRRRLMTADFLKINRRMSTGITPIESPSKESICFNWIPNGDDKPKSDPSLCLTVELVSTDARVAGRANCRMPFSITLDTYEDNNSNVLSSVSFVIVCFPPGGSNRRNFIEKKIVHISNNGLDLSCGGDLQQHEPESKSLSSIPAPTELEDFDAPKRTKRAHYSSVEHTKNALVDRMRQNEAESQQEQLTIGMPLANDKSRSDIVLPSATRAKPPAVEPAIRFSSDKSNVAPQQNLYVSPSRNKNRIRTSTTTTQTSSPEDNYNPTFRLFRQVVLKHPPSTNVTPVTQQASPPIASKSRNSHFTPSTNASSTFPYSLSSSEKSRLCSRTGRFYKLALHKTTPFPADQYRK